MLLRLRIALPDRPGALGQVTGALGAAGADITQVTVLDRGEGRALDDFTVYWPDAAPRDDLVRALDDVEGVRIEGVWSTREAPAPIRSWRSSSSSAPRATARWRL